MGRLPPFKKKKSTDSFYRCGNLGSEQFSDLLKVTTRTQVIWHLVKCLAHSPTLLLILRNPYFKLFQQEP